MRRFQFYRPYNGRFYFSPGPYFIRLHVWEFISGESKVGAGVVHNSSLECREPWPPPMPPRSRRRRHAVANALPWCCHRCQRAADAIVALPAAAALLPRCRRRRRAVAPATASAFSAALPPPPPPYCRQAAAAVAVAFVFIIVVVTVIIAVSDAVAADEFS